MPPYIFTVEEDEVSFVGPLHKTVVDFWRMVWQEKAHSIVMITNLSEGGKTACEQYWPDSGTQEFGPFQVTLTDQHTLADYIIRRLKVEVCYFIKTKVLVTNTVHPYSSQEVLAVP